MLDALSDWHKKVIQVAGDAPSSHGSSTAYLGSRGRYTLFSHGGAYITVIAPANLERYIEVTKWDHGLIAVMTKYAGYAEPLEEYIDLTPTLRELSLDPKEFCAGIDHVAIGSCAIGGGGAVLPFAPEEFAVSHETDGYRVVASSGEGGVSIFDLGGTLIESSMGEAELEGAKRAMDEARVRSMHV